MLSVKRLKTNAILVVFIGLWLMRVVLSQAAKVTAGIESLPSWISSTLAGIASVIGALMFLVIVALVIVYGKKIVISLMSVFDFDFSAQEKAQPEPEQDRAEAITRDLAQTVISLERHGSQSSELITSVESQTAALTEIVKKLATKATDLAGVAASFTFALEAIASKDPQQIALAAGKVKDSHIRNLMLLPYSEGNADYWASTSNLIATQLGTAERWQSEYSKMAVSLMAEVSQIKTGLTAALAHIEAAETARPLLQAKVNLETAGRYLRLPVSEQASPTRLLSPQNEYQLPDRSVR